MTTEPGPNVVDLGDLHRVEYARVLAAVAASTRDLELAEESVQEAFAAALRTWPVRGVPERPGAWLTTVARRRAIDVVRREGRRARLEREATEDPGDPHSGAGGSGDPRSGAGEGTDHDRLRLSFLTCHPSFSATTRVAMTLRFVFGLRTREIARLLAMSESAVHKQIQRARGKVRDARIPLRFPAPERVAERLPSVLDCLRLVFTEGYAATSGDDLIRSDLCRDAIALTRAAVRSFPEHAATRALLALELLQDARRDTRVDVDGAIVLLEDQDRARWDRSAITEALDLLDGLGPLRDVAGTAPDGDGRASVADPSTRSLVHQAAIAAVHARAESFDVTDWAAMLDHYDALLALTGSDVVALNRVVVVHRVRGASVALEDLDRIDPARVGRVHLLHAVRADLLEACGDLDGARRELDAAIAAAGTAPERALLEERRRGSWREQPVAPVSTFVAGDASPGGAPGRH